MTLAMVTGESTTLLSDGEGIRSELELPSTGGTATSTEMANVMCGIDEQCADAAVGSGGDGRASAKNILDSCTITPRLDFMAESTVGDTTEDAIATEANEFFHGANTTSFAVCAKATPAPFQSRQLGVLTVGDWEGIPTSAVKGRPHASLATTEISTMRQARSP